MSVYGYKLRSLDRVGKKTDLYADGASRSDTVFLGNGVVWNFDILIDGIGNDTGREKTILFYSIKFCLDFYATLNEFPSITRDDFDFPHTYWRRLGQAGLHFGNEVVACFTRVYVFARPFFK